MLREIDPGLFEGATDSTVRIAAIAQNNNGTKTARFRYGSTSLTTEDVEGNDGCEFKLIDGINQFKVGVVFDPSAPNARFDLFQVNDAGVLEPLGLGVSAQDATARIAFGINGVVAEVVVMARKSAKRTTKKKAARKKAARKKAATTAGRRIVRSGKPK
jgi:hypothetical protein